MTRERDDQHPEHSQRAQQQYCPAPVPSLASDLPVPSAQAAARALGVESLAHRLPHTASLSLAEPLHLAQAILNFTSREPPETLLPSCVPRSNFSPPPPPFLLPSSPSIPHHQFFVAITPLAIPLVLFLVLSFWVFSFLTCHCPKPQKFVHLTNNIPPPLLVK